MAKTRNIFSDLPPGRYDGITVYVRNGKVVKGAARTTRATPQSRRYSRRRACGGTMCSIFGAHSPRSGVRVIRTVQRDVRTTTLSCR